MGLLVKHCMRWIEHGYVIYSYIAFFCLCPTIRERESERESVIRKPCHYYFPHLWFRSPVVQGNLPMGPAWGGVAMVSNMLISKHNLWIDILNIQVKTTLLQWVPMDIVDIKSVLVQVIAWCPQPSSHHWPRYSTPYGVTSPQWVNSRIVLTETIINTLPPMGALIRHWIGS